MINHIHTNVLWLSFPRQQGGCALFGVAHKEIQLGYLCSEIRLPPQQNRIPTRILRMWMRKARSDWWSGAVADVIPEVSQQDRRSIFGAPGDKLSLNIDYEELRLDLFSPGKVFPLAILHHVARRVKNEREEKLQVVKRRGRR